MNKQFILSLGRLTYMRLPWIIILIGIILRLIRYLHVPSLYFDEAGASVDIIGRSFSDLINPSPDWSSKYPYGFLVLVKLATEAFGYSEYALRLIPLLFGILSVFLFYRVAKNYLNPPSVLVALGLFAILDPLIFQSSNVKPYSGDLAIALIITMWAYYIQTKKINMTDIALAGSMGALIIWFSHSSIFVLAGAGVSLAVCAVSKKEWARLGSLSVTYVIWIFSFIANYFIYVRHLFTNLDISVGKYLKVMENAYMPVPPTSIADIKWYIDLFFEIFNFPVGLTFAGIGAFSFLVGCISTFSEDKKKFLFIISPIVFTLLAAALHMYPFKDRLIIFLIPFMLLFIAEGTEYIRSRIIQSSKLIGIIFILLLLFHPLSLSAVRMIRPFYYEDLKPVLSYTKDNWQEGDILYVYYYAQYTFEYYSKYHPEPYRFNEGEYIIGIAPRGWYRHWRKQEVSKYYGPEVPIEQSNIEIFRIYAKNLDQLKGKKRVWILFTSPIPRDGIEEEKYFISHLENIGKQLDSFRLDTRSKVYLYDLSEQPAKNSTVSHE